MAEDVVCAQLAAGIQREKLARLDPQNFQISLQSVFHSMPLVQHTDKYIRAAIISPQIAEVHRTQHELALIRPHDPSVSDRFPLAD